MQQGLEAELARDPSLALDRGRLLDVAYESHAGAYERGGFGNLTFPDQLSVAFTPELGDSFLNTKAYPVFAKTAHLVNWTKWSY